MRVIAGECKGRMLKPVPGHSTRPTTDKVRESIFNMVGPFFEGGFALDLYGGSGALGIEALSRGIEKVIFVDRDAKAISVIKENLAQFGYNEKSEVYRNDSYRALKALKKRELSFSLILLDPPYHKQKLERDIETILDFGLLNRDGQLVAEHGVEVELPEEIGTLEKVKYESYSGTTAVSIYRFSNE
ncbi:16S rRNA (guanine(966)-N(2))-methyltransferase RsmD [Bacillus taeanensis]|uniref:16S rRNA (Guanine(966)-N(2))-methyltransferase RsmD n=1 Tax=Bacillus taeanensis TaxID=273032 RepID=A0A366XV15_9BACI|nr:16S rRNA (guanine(966)-N(2))-methyltransferase RsmD [Bacillus taeanensis]RBW70230.1 16S rRNA (guanine(966)-N(2))-methyltransferase RsmD [Bacillus taeanensis]